MTTNILSLPQLDGANTTIGIARNADWVDALSFSVPNSLPSITLSGCVTANGSDTVAVPATNALATGMPIVQSAQIPAGAYVGPLLSSTTFQMRSFYNDVVTALISDNAAVLTFLPLPLDLTGINFLASLRASGRIYLTAQTAEGTMLNGETTGVLRFAVPRALVATVPAGNYTLDILAVADGYTINLFPSGPASVKVVDGASDAALLVQA